MQLRATRLKQAPSLSSTLAAKLREEIESGRLTVGSPFPSDAKIADAFGVSRTVVREAVSALRAEGLVSTQRGRGSIVTSSVPRQPFGISQEEMNSIDDILKISELRSVLESEAAALAAKRRSDADIAKLHSALARLDAAIERGEDAMQEDVDLHLAIAAATGNEYFARLLGTFASIFVARKRVRSDLRAPEALRAYLDLIQGQHRTIVDAIARGDAETAAATMRTHLDASRYRALQARQTDQD